MSRLVTPLVGTEWRVFECADCEDEAYRYIAPVSAGASPDESGPLDFCPTCESYLSFRGLAHRIAVTNS